MNVIPAQVAGVETICVACPHPSAEIMGIAAMAGRHAFFPHGRRAGHRRAGVWNGDRSAVDRIVGPGNIYVAAAKKLIAGETGIDFVAGPTEIVIIAAEGNPRWIAADMLAQAEHDVDASAILLTTSRDLAEAVAEAVERQLAFSADRGRRAAVDRQQRRDCDGRFAGARGRVFECACAGAPRAA